MASGIIQYLGLNIIHDYIKYRQRDNKSMKMKSSYKENVILWIMG